MDNDLNVRGFWFQGKIIDSLESYDFEIDDDPEWDEQDGETVMPPSDDFDAKKLVYPYDRNEPQLSDEEMMELDSIADRVELTRLKGMGVLLDASCLDDGNYKQLSTRFVRGWRDKEMMMDGQDSVQVVNCGTRISQITSRSNGYGGM